MKDFRLDEVGVSSIRKDIAENVERVLARLGVHTNVSVSEEKIYNGRYLVTVESETFNTTPVIYKWVLVHGSGFITQDEEDERIANLYLHLDYRFKYFDGGENGVDIGMAVFRFFKGDEGHEGRTLFDGLTLR